MELPEPEGRPPVKPDLSERMVLNQKESENDWSGDTKLSTWKMRVGEEDIVV